MSRPKKNWLAIVCAYRNPETDLQNTLDAAAKSAGKGAVIYAVEDKDHTGPGRNRNKGIEAAAGAEVIILIDAHMRFRGDVLHRMALQVKNNGGLLVPFCHHNAECSFNGNAPKTGANYYAGARIVYKAKDGAQQTSLCAKWARDKKPGPRGAVMGACYAFRRDWYFDVGQPLAMLSGWGCDEEALSIAAWMSGRTPELFDGHVAHLWRAKSPWQAEQTQSERFAIRLNRMALIYSAVTDANARRELEQWTNTIRQNPSPEAERFRLALLKQPRKWREWRDQVCEPEEIDGKQAGRQKVAVDRNNKKETRIINIRVPVSGVRCPHCYSVFEKLPITHTFPNGNRRHKCPTCGNPFISFLIVPQHKELFSAR